MSGSIYLHLPMGGFVDDGIKNGDRTAFEKFAERDPFAARVPR